MLLLFLIILIEGFVSISVEMLTIRQLLPVVGSSVIVTSLVIGIFLLFLALGYQRGGRDCRYPMHLLKRNFFIAACWIGIGLSYAFITLFFNFTESLFGHNIFLSLTLYLLMITAPLIYILGQTVPMTMNMVNQELSVGTIGGNVLGLSTIGSFLGAILTTLVFMNFFGVAWTIFFNFIILMALVLLLVKKREEIIYYLLMIVVTGWLVFIINIRAEHLFFFFTNNYGNYQVLTHDNSNLKLDEKILMINGTYSSYINSQNKGFPYIELIKKILFADMKLHDADILVLGAGGFSMSAENTHKNKITYIDIDPQLKKVVVQKFAKTYNGTLINDDARHFVRSSQNTYDAIFVDVYSGTLRIPTYLLTKEFMQELQHRLKASGTILMNVIANPYMQDNYSKRVDNTIRQVFKNCVTFPDHYINQNVNIVYACQHSSKKEDSSFYTDNLNHSSIDSLLNAG